MSDDDGKPEYVIKKSVSDIEYSSSIYVKAGSKSEAEELFDHANDAEIR